MKKVFEVEFVIAGTRQLHRCTWTTSSEKAILNHLAKNYGHCEYLKITEIE